MARILVVDDDEMVCSIMARMLGTRGYSVTMACGGREALEQIEQEMPDAILSDMKMPDMDGEAFFHAVRARDAQVAFIGMSGHLYDREVGELGFDAFLQKPFRLNQLLEVVEQVLEGQPVA